MCQRGTQPSLRRQAGILSWGVPASTGQNARACFGQERYHYARAWNIWSFSVTTAWHEGCSQVYLHSER
jgi:hypothetical protein